VTQRTIEELVAEFVERREAGERLSPGDFVAQHPEQADALERALAALAGVEAAFPQAPELPARVGRFEVLSEIGRGGAGRVLEVREKPGGPSLALKLLGLAASADPRARERFLREGAVLARIDHPHVVRVREAGEADGQPYLLMDRVSGRTLEELVRQVGQVPARATASGAAGRAPCDALDLPGEGPGWRRVARMMAKLARAVAAVHASGVVHRDLKPSNVVVTAEGEPVLVDFGLVGAEDAATLTRTGDVLGTPQYMSSEQARGERADPSSDVFSLGAILVELLTLARPRARAPLAALDEARRRPLLATSGLSPLLQPALRAIAYRATAFRRERRTRSAAELAEQLEALLAGSNPRVLGPTLLERVADAARRRPSAVAAGVAVVVLLASAAALRREFTRAPAPIDAAALERRRERLADASCALLDERPDAALRLARELLALDGEDAQARLLRALADPGGGGLVRDGLSPAHQELLAGVELEREGRKNEAAAAFGRAVELAPGDALAVGLRARAAWAAGDKDLAARELKLAARLLPRCGTLRRLNGLSLHASGSSPEAAEELSRAAELLAGDYRVHKELAVVLAAAGQNERGLAAAQKALALVDTAEAGAVLDSILHVYASLLDHTDRRAEAERFYRGILARRPELTSVRFNFALCLDAQDRLAEARAEYERVLAEDPKEARAAAALGWFHSGSNRASCARCREFFEADPGALDLELAVDYALRALDLDRGRDRGVTRTVAAVARNAGATAPIADRLRELLEEVTDESQVLHLQESLRTLSQRER
jgi:Flp pilus assembly protein TadD